MRPLFVLRVLVFYWFHVYLATDQGKWQWLPLVPKCWIHCPPWPVSDNVPGTCVEVVTKIPHTGLRYLHQYHVHLWPRHNQRTTSAQVTLPRSRSLLIIASCTVWQTTRLIKSIVFLPTADECPSEWCILQDLSNKNTFWMNLRFLNYKKSKDFLSGILNSFKTICEWNTLDSVTTRMLSYCVIIKMCNGLWSRSQNRMEIKSSNKKEKNDEGEACKKDPLDNNRMRISTITALARAIHQQSVARRKFQQNDIGK